VPDVRAKWRVEIETHIPKIIERLAAAAVAGDVQAAGLLLARCVPPVRPEAATVRLDVPEGASTADAVRAVLAAVAAGRLAPDAAKNIVDVITAGRQLEVVEELAERVRLLEQQQRGEHEDDRQPD
jgi:hypothetical protein